VETLDRENKALKGHAKSLDRMVEELRAEQSLLHVHLRRLASHIDAVEAGHAAAMLQLARYAGPGGRLRMLARVIGLPRISRAKEGKS
jgi:hypothetical protein